ncbi:MAG TPA: 2'-5' RNA ligase family protein [Bryobacteraceae bacterium]|nr:2'-5' RNA ligase family protein [Bryobacteraceae bacterium]
MYKDPTPWDRINSFALVSYLPEPLAGFLDRLRQELVPNCFLHAHVTVLPPRPVAAPNEAWAVVKNLVARFEPFEVRMTDVEVFPVSDVIYVNVEQGGQQLRLMHDVLAVDGLEFTEQFAYHPHVTLAQELKPDELDELVAVARARWAELALDKSFRVEKIAFVQNTRRNEWIDLAECALGQSDSEVNGELTGLLAE